jgi:hypothetical protein
MQAVLLQEQRWQQAAVAGTGVGGTAATAAGSAAPDAAAVAAKHAYLAVQAAVAVLQLEQVLSQGDIAVAPPCPLVTEADVRRVEVREQATVALPAAQRMPCTVCFSRGQERSAYFAVEGLPTVVRAGETPGEAGRHEAACGCMGRGVVPSSAVLLLSCMCMVGFRQATGSTRA